jgi:hypothetical protein
MKSTFRIGAFCALACILGSRLAIAAPSDSVQVNSVWATDSGETLTILERKGDWFQGRYQANFDNVVREMSGTVKDDQIFWLSKDITVLRGYGSGDCYGTFDGDKFYLNSYNSDGTWHSTFYLRQPTGSAAQAASAEDIPGSVPWIGVFSGEVSNANAWTFLPLTTAVPPAIRDNVAALDSALRIEASKTPQASLEAYASADKICRFLMYDLDDREAILKRNRQDAQGNLTPEWENQWENRCTRYHSTIQAEYERFVDAVNRSEKPNLPVGAVSVAFVPFPTAPGATAAPLTAANAAYYNQRSSPNNPAEHHGADDYTIWSPYWGPKYDYYRHHHDGDAHPKPASHAPPASHEVAVRKNG